MNSKKIVIYFSIVILVASSVSLFLLNKINKYSEISISKVFALPRPCPGSSKRDCPSGWSTATQESGGRQHCNKDGQWCRRVNLECIQDNTSNHCILDTIDECTDDVQDRCLPKTPKPSHSPKPTKTPNPTPTVTPTSTPVVTSSPTPTVTPTATPGEPNYCGGTCGSNYNCQGGYFCYQGYCRNPLCSNESDCNCKSTPTAPPVLGTTTTKVLPKTGGGLGYVSVSSILGIVGFWLLKKK